MDYVSNIQAYPTPEQFITGGNPVRDFFEAANTRFALSGYFDAQTLNSAITDAGNGSFVLSLFNDNPSQGESAGLDETGNAGFALTAFQTSSALLGGEVVDASNNAFKLSSFTNVTASNTGLSEAGNAAFALTTVTM